MPELNELDASQLAAGYAAGTLDPVEVVAASLATIDLADPVIHAMYDRYDERALAAAEQSRLRWARGEQLSPLDGVPVTLKENQQVAGHPTPWGSATTLTHPAEHNAPVVDKILDAGACLLGRTTMPELGMLSSGVSSLHPTTRNPWDLRWSPGGSSSGAGAASAAGYAPINLGSDIGGSVRLPASWCGVAGFKPTYAKIPVDPPFPGRTIGPMGRRVADLARAMAVVSGVDAADPWSLPNHGADWFNLDIDIGRLRVGIVLDVGDGAPVDREVASTVVRAAETFAKAGAAVIDIPPYLTPGTVDLVDKFWRAGHYRKYQRMSEDQRQKMLPFIAEWCRGAASLTAEDVLEAHDAQITLGRTVLAATQGVDIVISPVSPGTAFPAEWPMPSNDVNDPMSHIHHCVGYNFSGMPAASVNGGFSAAGSPIGVQIAAGRHQDLTALAAAAFFEAERPDDALRPWPRIPASASR